MTNTTENVRCSFCNKSSDQVKILISAEKGIYICDECVEACVDIIRERTGDSIGKEQTVTCHQCGQELPDDAELCHKCGTKVIRQLFCPKCGKKLPQESEFCMFCGSAINCV